MRKRDVSCSAGCGPKSEFMSSSAFPVDAKRASSEGIAVNNTGCSTLTGAWTSGVMMTRWLIVVIPKNFSAKL